jgi:hypothetical protein
MYRYAEYGRSWSRTKIDWLLAPQRCSVSSVADPDPVGSGPFWSDPYPDVWDRIRILALINDHISIVCLKAKDIFQESLLFNCLVHEDTF